MKTFLIYIIPVFFLASCITEDIFSPDATDSVELEGVTAVIYDGTSTRAAALDAYNYVGRSAFADKDIMELTTIKRTVSPINGFTYKGIKYEQTVGQGQTSGGWDRVPDTGCYKNKDGEWGTTAPERIYWSDATNGHTYIGFSAPQQPQGMSFDWTVKDATYEGSGTIGVPVYYGSLGDPKELIDPADNTKPAIIGYTNNADETPVDDIDQNDKPTGNKSYKTGNEKIKRDDILLTYDDAKIAETGGSVAKLYFYHGLAMARVVVNIQGFSVSTDAADSKSVVKDMVLKDMLTLYKWKQMSNKTEALDERYDMNNINDIYNNGNDGPVTCNQKKDVHMWIPRPLGSGSGVGRQFTFYALAVPRTMGVNVTDATTDEQKAKNLHFEFKVQYPDPMNPVATVEKTYKAMMDKSIEFRAGYCTTINITLNHSNEQMTIGAEYMDWQMIETPDDGELKKNSTFLKAAPALENRDDVNVTIVGDSKATVDDATWLYKGANNEILDIYGNDGSATKPYTISTANQMLSFAYEVKSGRDFAHKFVKLDADIVLQPSLNVEESERVTWLGIGDESHQFNGFFLGSGRHINSLYGEHFFHTVGDNAVIDKLNFDDVIEVQGCGVIAHVNNGLICSCYIDGDVKETADANTQYTGSIVGVNNSFIIACAHVGKVTGYGKVGGLVGFNNGTVMASYHSGKVEVVGSGEVHPTVGKVGKATVSGENDSYMFSCYYDKNVFEDNRNLEAGRLGYPFTTATMQSNGYVNSTKTYVFNDNTWSYSQTDGKNAKQVLMEILKAEEPSRATEDAKIKELMSQLIAYDKNTQNTNKMSFKLFEYHFSLNEALKVFRYWLEAIDNATESNETVQTNCHVFTKAQITFLKTHYTANHIYVYVPAAYPKTQ